MPLQFSLQYFIAESSCAEVQLVIRHSTFQKCFLMHNRVLVKYWQFMFLNYLAVNSKDLGFHIYFPNFLNTGVSINFVEQVELVSL